MNKLLRTQKQRSWFVTILALILLALTLILVDPKGGLIFIAVCSGFALIIWFIVLIVQWVDKGDRY